MSLHRRSSDPRWPRVMRWRSVRARRSVGRGRVGWAIEPRNTMSSGCRRFPSGGRQHRWRRYREPLVDPARSENPGTHVDPHAREPGGPTVARGCCDARPDGSRGGVGVVGPRGERLGGNPLMHDRGKSDGPVVPAKPPNKPGRRGRRWWREGAGRRGTRPAKHAPDPVPGRACQVSWIVCAAWRARTGMCGSPRSFTT